MKKPEALDVLYPMREASVSAPRGGAGLPLSRGS